MTLSHSQLLQLKRWNTPTVYNGWERITRSDPARDGFNLAEARDFMPALGPMVGYAVTLVVEPSNPKHAESRLELWSAYRRYLAEQPGPKIVVVQDLDWPNPVGSFWGEVTANVHRALGCVGTVTAGAIRDVDEMHNAGFKALAERLCVGHAHSCPVAWGDDVEVFGRVVAPGDLIHADKHGFLAIPEDDHDGLLEAAIYMDALECETMLAAARDSAGRSIAEVLDGIDAAASTYRVRAREKFERPEGEW